MRFPVRRRGFFIINPEKTMSDLLLSLCAADVAPETGRPDPARLIAGDPVFTTWNVEDRHGLWCGIWQSTPGK